MTLPAHCSMLTGSYPETHGVHGNFARLGEGNVTLAKVMRTRGLSDGRFRRRLSHVVAVWSRPGLRDLRRPVSSARETPAARPDARPKRSVAGAWHGWTSHGGQPFFLFLHYYDPHYPYDPPPPFPPTYDGELAYTDVWVGKVIDKLRELGLYDNTLVVLVGDHGEGLSEHGEKEHGFLIYQNTLHVPLIVRAPGRARRQPDRRKRQPRGHRAHGARLDAA